MVIPPELRRAARRAVGLSQGDLARAAHVGVGTIRNYEAGHRLMNNNLAAVEHALQAMGVRVTRLQHGNYSLIVRPKAGSCPGASQ